MFERVFLENLVGLSKESYESDQQFVNRLITYCDDNFTDEDWYELPYDVQVWYNKEIVRLNGG